MNALTKQKFEIKELRKAKARSLKMIRDLEKKFKLVFDPKLKTRIQQRLDFLEHIEAVLTSLGDKSKKLRPRRKA